MNKIFLTAALALSVLLVFGVQSAMTEQGKGGKELVEERCTQCHDLVRVERAKGSKDRVGWGRTVDRMIDKRSGLLNNEERDAVLEYLLSD